MPPTRIHRRPRGRSPNTVSRAREPGPTHLPAPTLRHLPGACLCRQGSLPRTAAEDFANPVRPGAPFPGSPSSVSAAPFPPGVSRMLWAQYTCMPVPTRASVSPLRAGPPGPGPTAHSLAGGPREATTALQACRLSTAPAVQEEGDQSQEACEGGCLCPLGPTGSLLAQAEVSGQVRALRGPAPPPPPIGHGTAWTVWRSRPPEDSYSRPRVYPSAASPFLQPPFPRRRQAWAGKAGLHAALRFRKAAR